MSVRHLLPAMMGGGAAPEPEMGDLLAVSIPEEPFVLIYERTGHEFIPLPTAEGLFPERSRFTFSPDGKFAATCRALYIRDGRTFTRLPDPIGGWQGAYLWNAPVLFTSEGDLVAASSAGISLYRKEGNDFIHASTFSPGSVSAMKISPDGKILAVGIGSSPWLRMYILNGSGFSLISNPTGYSPTNRARSANGIAFSPDNSLLAVALGTSSGQYTHPVSVYERSGDTFGSSVGAGSARANDADMTSGGAYLAIASSQSSGDRLRIRKRNPDGTYSGIPTDTNDFSARYSVSFSKDGKLLADAGGASVDIRELSGNQVEIIATVPVGADWVTFSPLLGPPPPPMPGLIGTPGKQGFGVGVCPDNSWLTELGLSELPGTRDTGSPEYGNYQHDNGSVVVFVPKFFYRIGNSEHPSYSTYGSNSMEVVGIETFVTEAEANAAGFALHRAFIDDNKEKPGFFYDKYFASDDGGVGCKSVKNAQPFSLSGQFSPGYVGAGPIRNAVNLCRARGYGWNCQTQFMRGAINFLVIAHLQAASSEDHCAWWDSAGLVNFPKGCNDGNLGDVDDPSVSYTTSGEEAAGKPLTGSGEPFAKTTHNGQECGIADLNGVLWEMTIGATHGNTTIAEGGSPDADAGRVLSRSAVHADIVDEHGTETGAWPSYPTLHSQWDAISPSHWGVTANNRRMGNSSSPTFDDSVSGTNYVRSCLGFPLDTGVSSTGTPLFGMDFSAGAFVRQGATCFGGRWDSNEVAGVFAYILSYRVTSNDPSVGFRAGAYGS